jgi:HK97 family phage portal protein
MLGNLFTRGAVEGRDLSYQQIWGSGLDVSTLTTWAGTPVSSSTATQLGAVYACTRLLADTISSLPVDTFIRREGNRLPFRPRPEWVYEPEGPGSSRIEYFKQVVTSMLLSHGAVIQVIRGGNGDVLALQPLDPTRVTVQRNPATRAREFVVDGRDVLTADQVLYICEMRKPGSVQGTSRIEEVKNTLGLAKALDEFASRYFSNGANAGGIIEFPGNLTQEQARDVVEAFEAGHRGLRKSHKPGVLSGGAKFMKVGSDAEQAQMLQSRQFSVEEIARIFRVPPSMIGLNTPGAMSYASVEHNAIQFVRYSLTPLISAIEEAHNRLLPGDAFLRVNMDGLLRGDSATQAQVFSTAMQAGYMSVNDVRTIMDMRPVDGGDLPRVPLANISVGAADLIEQAQRVEMASKLVQIGFDPVSVMEAFNLPTIQHTGIPSNQLQSVGMHTEDEVQAVYPPSEG